MRLGALPADGGASYLAGFGSTEVAVATLGVFLVCYAIAAFSSATWLAEVAFVALVAGGLAVTWPIMILLTGAALMVAMVVGVAHRVLAPKRAARIEAEAEVQAAAALRKLAGDRGRESP